MTAPVRPAAIHADHLGTVYRVKVRDAGLAGTIGAISRPGYREVRAVDGVSFTIAPGEIVTFLGPNGAGETTTLKMLTGLLVPTTGRALVAGIDPWAGSSAFKRRIALVLGNKQLLLWDLPADETFRLNARRLGRFVNDPWRRAVGSACASRHGLRTTGPLE